MTWSCKNCGYPVSQDEKPKFCCPQCRLMSKGEFAFIPQERFETKLEKARQSANRKAKGTKQKKRARFPAVIGDKLPKHFDWAIGKYVTSRTERNRAYREKGLLEKSAAEQRRQHPSNAPQKIGTAYSYPGQKDRRSTTERTRVTME